MKSVIYWTSKHGALMVPLAHERPEGLAPMTTPVKKWDYKSRWELGMPS